MIVGGVIAGVMGLIFAVGLVALTTEGRYGSAAGFVGMTALALGLAVAASRYGSSRVAPRVTVSADGTMFRPDPRIDVPMAVAYLGVLWNFGVTLLRPMGDDPWPAVVPSWLTMGVVLLGGVAMTCVLCLLLWGYLRWGASKCLRLTPVGVEMGQGFTMRSCRWDQVLSVTDRHPRGRRRTPSAVALSIADEKAMFMTTSTFTAGGWQLRCLVEFYWGRPEARGELVDGVAADRLTAIAATH